MCLTVWVDGAEVVDTRDLSERLGVPLVMLPGYAAPTYGDGCLCGCDVDAMARAAGWSCRQLREDEPWGDLTLTKCGGSAGRSGSTVDRHTEGT